MYKKIALKNSNEWKENDWRGIEVLYLAYKITKWGKIVESQKKYLTEKQVAEITGRALSTIRDERFLNRGMPSK